MPVELAVGYISLVADASQIPGAVNRALGRAGQTADRQGESIGRRMAGGIGLALKAGVTTAAVAAGGVIATALTKGFGRLTAIDDAQGKLKGLGHDALSIQTIMDSALKSVQGTAFGLGDAATVAATAVAAGIKPGQELTNHLKLVADAATIAGTGIGEMGSIFAKVATSNKIQGDVINQLGDVGIPIIQLLATEMGVAADTVAGLAADGKVDFETFSKAMQKGLGGAALASGKTVRGAVANTNAALGRLGAAALGPVFGRLTGWFGALTAQIDGATKSVSPFAQTLDALIFKRVVPGVTKMWASFTKSDAAQFLSNALAQATGIIGGLADAARDAAPSVASIARSLTGATGALGVGAWSVLVTVLQSVTQIANSVLVPTLGAVAGLMSSNKVAVVALVAAWLAFKTIPRYMQAIGTSLAGVQTRATGALGGIRGVASATGGVAQVAGVGATNLGRFGSAVQQMGAHTPAIARMQQSFLDSAAGASRFGRTAGTAAAAMSGMRTAASGVVSALGGPWTIAIVAATLGVIKFTSDMRKHEESIKAVDAAWRSLLPIQNDIAKIFNVSGGDFNSDAIGNVTDQVHGLNDAMETAGKNRTSWSNTRALFQAPWNNSISKENNIADQYEAARGAVEKLGVSERTVAEAMTNDSTWNDMKARLEGMGAGGQFAAKNYQWLRDEIMKSRETAKATTPGFFGLGEAVKKLSDESATAADRLSAMKQALDILAGRQLSAQDALAKYNEQVRDTAKVTQEWNAALGTGAQLIGQNGQVNTATENGDRLYKTLLGIRDVTVSVAEAGDGVALDKSFAQNDQQFQDLATAVGLTKQQIIDMATAVGYLPTDIRMLASLQGAGDVTQQLTVIADLLTRNRAGVVIPAKALTTEARAELEKLGVTIEAIPGTETVRIVAQSGEVLTELQRIAAFHLADKTQTVIFKSDLSGYTLPPTVKEKLHEDISGIPIAPRAEGGIDNLPGQATMWSPKTRLYQVSEPETGGEAFIPLAPSKRGRSLDILGQVASMFGLGLTKMADGGLVPKGVASALAGARSATGTKYVWGGTTTAGFDCSGFVGWLQQLLQGIANPAQRLYTTMSLLGGSTAGLKQGFGPAGTYFQVGVNGQHMAATLNGQPVESGGSHGDARIGSPAVGANDKQFTGHFYLPNELIDGISAAGVSAGSGKSSKTKKAKEWTEADQIDLDQAALAVEEAKKDRDEVYKDNKKTDLDRRKADLSVREAQQRLVDKQAEKDGSGKESDLNTPEAPPLGKRLNDDEVDAESANLSRDEAQAKRNEVYADPESTDNDKRRADLDLQSAENSILDLQDKKDEKKTVSGTVSDRIKKFGADIFGIVFDGLREQLPFGLGQSRWWDIPITTVESQADDKKKSRTATPGNFSQDDVNKQLPVTLGADPRAALEPYINRAPASIQDWLKQFNIGVHDQGGWLKPGEMALNLSNRPEPILNSPAQMRQFMNGADLAPATAVAPDFSVHVHNPQFSDGQTAIRAATNYQERQMMRHAGRPF